MFKERIKQTAWQVPLLIIAACLIAIGVNDGRTDDIALVGNWSADARASDDSGNSLVIDIEAARRLFRQEAALFVDARPQSLYAEGHIRGALSIPWQEADRYFTETADRLDGASVIITYCDGESCDLSHELALFLKDLGFENVRVLVNGMTVWQQADMPVQRGMTP